MNQHRKDESKVDPCSKQGWGAELIGAPGDLKALRKLTHSMSHSH